MIKKKEKWRKIEYDKRLKIEREKQKGKANVCSLSQLCNMPPILLGVKNKWFLTTEASSIERIQQCWFHLRTGEEPSLETLWF
jgi:hypothetical protein